MKKSALTILALLAASSAWAIKGTIQSEKGGSYTGDIKWNARNKVYVIASQKGGTTVEAQCALADVAGIEVPKPAGLDRAIEAVQNGQGASAIPALQKISTDYKMLVWDKPAARYLVLAYLAANNAKEAEKVAQGLLADDRDAAWKGEFAPSYWQVLLKLGQYQKLENCLKKAATSGDRATSAEALNMRGDIIVAQGGDAPDAYNRALVDGYLRVALLYLDEPCQEARLAALQKAAMCFDKLGQAVRAEDMRSRAKAM